MRQVDKIHPTGDKPWSTLSIEKYSSWSKYYILIWFGWFTYIDRFIFRETSIKAFCQFPIGLHSDTLELEGCLHI